MTDVYIVANDNYQYDDEGYSQSGPDGKLVHLTEDSALDEAWDLVRQMLKEGYGEPEGWNRKKLLKAAGLDEKLWPEEMDDAQLKLYLNTARSESDYPPFFKIVRMQMAE